MNKYIRLSKRIKWGRVILAAVLVSSIWVNIYYVSAGRKNLIERIRYSQLQEERLNSEVKRLDDENDNLRGQKYLLELDLDNANERIKELQGK